MQVEDENHKPVAGAAVVFFLPSSGPGGTFANGSQTLTVTTDSTDHAAATGIKPNHQLGQGAHSRHRFFQRIESLCATITQMNVAGANEEEASAPERKCSSWSLSPLVRPWEPSSPRAAAAEGTAPPSDPALPSASLQELPP